jgi:hypothetical protein
MKSGTNNVLIHFLYVMEEHVKKQKILKNLKKTKILPWFQ